MDQAEQLRNIIKAGNVKRSRPLARVITVTSGKGGVGKSNTAINLAIQFRKMGKKVVILDADFGLANIEIMFGAVPKHNLSDLIYQGKNIKDIITWGPMEVGFISGGSGITGLSNLSKDYLTYIVHNLAELDTIADVIIVDTGAGISDAVLEFLVASGEILLVTTPEPTSITDSYSLLKALNGHPGLEGQYADLYDSQSCQHCKRRRSIIPKTRCSGKPLPEASHYLFGCCAAGSAFGKGCDAAASGFLTESAGKVCAGL